MNAKELKPCPFCGSTSSLNSDHVDFFVMCDTCSGEGPRLQSPTGNHEASKRGAVEAWNKRAALPSDAAQAAMTDEQILRLADACGLYGVRRGALAFAREVLKDAAPVAPAAAAPSDDAEHMATIDVRDLFAFLRAAWREGQHHDREDMPDQADSWSAASDYANKVIGEWTGKTPAAQPVDPFRHRVERLLVELHNEERLSEGQCAKVLDIDRISWRKIADVAALERPTAAQPDERAAAGPTGDQLRAIIRSVGSFGTNHDDAPTAYVLAGWRAARATAPQATAPWTTDAARDVLAERARQVTGEGWTPTHDDQYGDHEMSCAAGCYAMHTLAYPAGDPPPAWPWAADWWKPTTHRRNLIKAAALILAEIERIDRAASANESADAQDDAQ